MEGLLMNGTPGACELLCTLNWNFLEINNCGLENLKKNYSELLLHVGVIFLKTANYSKTI
jgi:hypothetical protein